MRRQERQDIQRKKQAFHSLIRHNHIQRYFTSVRQGLCKSSAEDHSLRDEVLQLIEQLPASAALLADKVNDSLATVSQVLIANIDNFCSKIVRPNMVDWCHLVHIVSRMLVSTADKKAIEAIVNHSLLPLLEGAQVLLSTSLNQIEQNSLMEALLDYCYRLGMFVANINQLEQNALVATLQSLWLRHWDRQNQIKLAQMMLNILSMNFEPQDVENIKPSQQADLELSKIMIITQVFYKSKHNHTLGKLLGRLTALTTEEEEDSEMEQLYLRLLITITLYLSNSCYYYPLLELHLLHVISVIMCLRDNTTNTSPLILSIRLLNNILVNDWKLTQEVLQSINMSRIISLHQQNQHLPEVQSEIIQFFINLLHFMNDDSYLVRDLVNLGCGQVMISAFELDSEYISEDKLSQAVNALIIMDSKHPHAMKTLFLAQDRLFQKAMDLHPHCASQIEYLLSEATSIKQSEPQL